MLIQSLPKPNLEEMELISQVICGVVVKGHDYKVFIEQYEENVDCEMKISFRLFKGEGEYWLETSRENTNCTTYQRSSNYIDLIFHFLLILNDFLYDDIYIPTLDDKYIRALSEEFYEKVNDLYRKATEMVCNIDLLKTLAINDSSLETYCEIDTKKLAISLLNNNKKYRLKVVPITHHGDVILIVNFYIEKIDNGYSLIISFKNNEITSMTSPLNIPSNYNNLGFTKDQIMNVIKCVEQFSGDHNLNPIIFGRTMGILNETIDDCLKEDSRKFVIDSYCFNFGINVSEVDAQWHIDEELYKSCKQSKVSNILDVLTSEIDNLPLINKLKLFVGSKFVDAITNLK